MAKSSQPEFGDTDFELKGLPQRGDDTDLRARTPLELLASQFVDELRRGERPSVTVYARRYPLHADVIRESFPVLEILEQARLQNEANAMRRSMPHRFPFTHLGGCELVREIGRGGMGVVFEARKPATGHVLALKVLPWRVSMVPEWRERFEEEARTAARLRHPHIVPVYRFGQEHGYCYYTMQFINGIGLDRVVERLYRGDGIVHPHEIVRQNEATDDCDPPQRDARRLRLTRTSWQGFVRIAIQAIQALRHAHRAGLLHNDVKPANILLDGDGHVWITDFGLSHSMETRTAAGALDRPNGTLKYLAPERFEGRHDARSDIYSFGLTLYELVALQPAVNALGEDRMIDQIRRHSLVPPSSHQPDLPRDLETIILNCVAADPDDRYQTADALLGDLLHFSQSQRIRSTRRTTLSRLIDRLGPGS